MALASTFSFSSRLRVYNYFKGQLSHLAAALDNTVVTFCSGIGEGFSRPITPEVLLIIHSYVELSMHTDLITLE